MSLREAAERAKRKASRTLSSAFRRAEKDDDQDQEPTTPKRKAALPFHDSPSSKKKKKKIDIPAPDVPTWEPRPSLAKKVRTLERVVEQRAEDAKSELTVQSNPALRDLDQAKAALDGLPKVYTVRSPSSQSRTNVDQAINNILLADPKAGRSYRGVVDLHRHVGGGKGYDRWVFSAIDSRQNTRFIATAVSSYYTKAEAKEIANALAALLNRWPGEVDDISTRQKGSAVADRSVGNKSDILIQAALCHIKPGQTVPIRALAPALKKTGKFFYVRVKLHAIDPNTFKLVQFAYDVSARNVKRAELPDVPDDALLLTRDNGANWERKTTTLSGITEFGTDVDDRIPEENKATYRKAEKLGHLLLWRLDGKTMSLDKLKNRAHEIVQEYGGQRQAYKETSDTVKVIKPYNFATHYHIRLISLFPSKIAKDNGVPDNRHISLPTLDKSWMIPVVSILEDTIDATGDYVKAFAEAARINDHVRILIAHHEPTPSTCRCDAKSQHLQTHPCAECMRSVVCSKRVRALTGLMVCTDCETGVRQSKFREQGAIESFLFKAVETSAKIEAGILRLSTTGEFYNENLKGMQNKISKLLADGGSHGLEWTSGVTGVRHELSPTRVRTGKYGRDAFAPSPDAIMPYSGFKDRYILHTDDNIWIIEAPLNFAKHIQLPVFLALIRYNLVWLDQNAASASPEELRKHTRKILILSQRYSRIRLKAGFTKAARMKRPFSAAKLDSDREEWIAAAERDEDGPWKSYEKRVSKYYRQDASRVDDSMKAMWSASEIIELKHHVERYETYFGVKLPEKDGCPYFCADYSMPDDWSWAAAFGVATERFVRMRDLCNLKGCTIDTPKSIFIFCIIAGCASRCIIDSDDPEAEKKQEIKQQLRDILGLPLAIETGNGLRFAIGHLHHDNDMFTGVHPTTFEWDFERCNVLVETCTTNWAKMDYPEFLYDDIVNMVRQIKLDGRTEGIYHRGSKILPRVALDEVQDESITEPDIDIDLDFFPTHDMIDEDEMGEAMDPTE